MSGCHLVCTAAVKIGLAGCARSAYGRRHEGTGSSRGSKNRAKIVA
jgi:hypothetical protein